MRVVVGIVLLAALVASNWWVTRVREAEDLVSARRESRPTGWSPASLHAVIRGTFWEIRRAAAIMTWAEAQTYFHGGFDLTAFSGPQTTGTATLEPPHDDHDEEACDDPAHHHEHDDDDERESAEHEPEIHTPEEVRKIRSVRDHPFLKRSPLRPYVFEHSHRDLGPKRMMPFYWFTTQLDPNFVRAYTNGSYWLAFKFDNVEEAHKYLDDGLRHNPDDPSLFAARGHIYFSIAKDYNAAAAEYEKAIQLNPAATDEQQEDYLEWTRYLGRAYLAIGENEAAIRAAERGKKVEPKAAGLDAIISEATTTTVEARPEAD
jgi:hypothetical protein